MPLGKTPAEIADDLAEKTAQLAEQLLEERFPGLYKHVEASEVPPFHRQAVRQALKDLLDHAIAEMPDEIPSDSVYTPECHPFEISSLYRKVNNNARNDCIAVLSKLKESV